MTKEVQQYLDTAVDLTAKKIGIKKYEILHLEKDFPTSWTWRKNFRNRSYADLVFALREEEYFKEGIVTAVIVRADKNFPSPYQCLSYYYLERFWDLETLVSLHGQKQFTNELELNLTKGWGDAVFAAGHISEILKTKEKKRLKIIGELSRLGINYRR